MSPITDGRVERYIYGILPRSPGILPELEAAARRRNVPIVGPLVGRFLYLLARVSGARRVLEVGTAIGYSAIWLGLAVKENRGRVITVEIEKDLAAEARRNIARAGLQRIVSVLEGDGLSVIPKLRGRFDLIFIDDSKQNYPRYLDLCVRKMNRNGLLIADNALWGGEVMREKRGEEADAIAKFNEMLMERMTSVIIPARDGVAIGMKQNRQN